jgi:uncharacterized Zn finger protein (UPF0148 family)
MNEKNIASAIAEFIKKGWKLTSLSCPTCNSPLVKKDDDYYCPVCERKIIVARDEEEAWEAVKKNVIDNLEKRVISKIESLLIEKDIDEGTLDLLIKCISLLKEIKSLKT